jgi:hypothetical protein
MNNSEETEYRIEYTIYRCQPGDADFVEVGFGSSGAWADLDTATHMIETAVQRREWESEKHHPAPEDV